MVGHLAADLLGQRAHVPLDHEVDLARFATEQHVANETADHRDSRTAQRQYGGAAGARRERVDHDLRLHTVSVA